MNEEVTREQLQADFAELLKLYPKNRYCQTNINASKRAYYFLRTTKNLTSKAILDAVRQFKKECSKRGTLNTKYIKEIHKFLLPKFIQKYFDIANHVNESLQQNTQITDLLEQLYSAKLHYCEALKTNDLVKIRQAGAKEAGIDQQLLNVGYNRTAEFMKTL